MLSTSGLFSDLDVSVELDAPIGSMTWYGIGGSADVLLRPNTVDALATLLKRCRRTKTPVRVLGRGANLLVADEGVDGIVVLLDTPAFTATRIDDAVDPPLLHAMAGADTAKTLMDCARRGLDGLSQMAGIPSTIGGALRMNAGGAYGAITDHLVNVTTLTRSGEQRTQLAKDLPFGYRDGGFLDPIILEATFEMHWTDPIALRERIKAIFEYKKSTQPLAEHSAGCVFKNPIDPEIEERVSAGQLIDEAGLKGTRIGGATVSTHHANFITVRPGAKATDVIAVMERVRAGVLEHAGIELENEIVVWKRSDGGGL